MIFVGVYTLIPITVAPVERNRPPAEICTKVYTLLRIPAALVHESSPPVVVRIPPHHKGICKTNCVTLVCNLCMYPLTLPDTVN